MKRRRSALESYDGCPYRYNQLYNLGIEDRGDESQRGIAFHEAAFRYIARLVKRRLVADADEARAAFIEGVALTQLPAHIVHEVARIWERFAEYFELDLDAYMAAEEQQEDERFTWIPDLVYVRPRGVEIKDWKTYYKGLTDVQARKEFQLKFYLVRAMDIWPGFPTYTFTFNFVRIGYEVSVSLTPDAIEKFRPEVESILVSLEAAEKTQSWPAIPGSHCTLCRLKCPIVDNPARLPARFTNGQDAADAAGEILALEQRLKALKKALAGWCNQEGPVTVKGQLFSHRSNELRGYAAGTVVDLLRDSYPNRLAPDGETLLDQGNLLQVSAGAIKKADPLKLIVQPKGALHPDLAAVETTSTRWAFRHSKAGAIEDPEPDEDADD